MQNKIIIGNINAFMIQYICRRFRHGRGKEVAL